MDISDPARPRLAHALTLDTSVYGPPTNLQITPDGRLGLFTSPVTMRQEGGNWWAQADDRLHVVDLAAEPSALIETIRVGRQPSGLAIARAGDVARVANRESRSVSVLGSGDFVPRRCAVQEARGTYPVAADRSWGPRWGLVT